jgi:tyrosyl-DNA phosphodiesterase-1
MIPRDWTNMTQAVWRSPLLPLMSSPPASQTDGHSYPVGSGERFKVDLFSYLNAYEKKLKGLTEQLVNYDFSTIQAAFVGSVPSRQKPAEARPMKKTSFGWLGVREILSTIPLSPTESQSAPNIVIQTSSIATLGALPTWITHLQSVLSHSSTSTPAATATASTPGFSKASTFFAKRPPTVLKTTTKPPTLNIIFPTADEIRASLDGYASGFSIHTKLQSAQQQKQLEYLRPIFCHWNHTSRSTSDPTKENSRRREACRGPAAPHIKTYIRFSDSERKSIDWAMVTSANLSKQAWGETENKKGEIWIQSWETGVIVWPELFKESGDGRERGRQRVRMVPVFGKDRPGVEDVDGDENMEGGTIEGEEKVVGFRMPYDLPLEPYGEKEIPWCATAEHRERDWKGKAWGGYHPH